MKKIPAFLLVLVTLTGIATLQSCQSSKNSTASKMLKFNLEKGKGYDYEMIMNMDVGSMMQMDMTNYYSMDVVADDGGTKTISTTYDRFKMKMNSMGMNLEVDTDKPLPSMGDDEKDPMKKDPLKIMNKVMSAIKGRKFLMKIDAEGKVLEVSGFEEMAKSIADSFHLDADKRKEVEEEFSKQFNEKSMRDQFERVLYIFPNKEIKVGDSWKRTTTPGGEVGGTYHSTYKVTDIEGDMVTIDEESTIDGDTKGVTLKGKITGTMVVNSKTGLVVTADQDMDMTVGTGDMTQQIKGKTKLKGKAR